jgi:medium-chain acyl-[acyl-carrier-protein] hydrolase
MTKTREFNPWVVPSKARGGEGLRLFCFPYAGGGPHIFRTWRQHLPLYVEVCPVQLPGHNGRLGEKAFTQLPPLVAALASGLRPLLDLPFAFFGHSLGAMISFELARHLRREGGPEPFHLFVSGSRAPQVPSTEPPTYDLPDDEFIEELKRLNGTPEELLEHEDLMKLMLPILRADFSICQTYSYTPEPALECPITAFGGEDDSETSEGRLEAWREQTNAHFRMHVYTGDHFFINAAQPLILHAISQELQQFEYRVRRA